MAEVLSINPGAIAAEGTDGGPGFALSKTEWISIQTYVTDALALPIDVTQFRNSLGPGAPTDLSDFTALISAYQAINTHCTTWQNTVFPAAVSLASDIYSYGMNKAPVYYPPILKEAQILEGDPDNADAKAALKAILDVLQTAATGYATKASGVAAQIQQFANDTAADQSTLVGPNRDAGLVKYYNDKYGTASADVIEINKELDAQRLILAAANAEYDHDVVVAATTPTYAWVWPIGTIAAAVVAGIYGHKAVEALDQARAAQAKINSLADELQADAKLMVAIHGASIGMNRIVSDLAAALPVVQKIQGVWGGIAHDLDAIAHLIDADIRQVPPIIMSLGVDEAVKSWHNVALNADAFRVNAYVKESGGPAASMLAWKVSDQLSSAFAPVPVAA